jgi:hypothetical protein
VCAEPRKFLLMSLKEIKRILEATYVEGDEAYEWIKNVTPEDLDAISKFPVGRIEAYAHTVHHPVTGEDHWLFLISDTVARDGKIYSFYTVPISVDLFRKCALFGGLRLLFCKHEWGHNNEALMFLKMLLWKRNSMYCVKDAAAAETKEDPNQTEEPLVVVEDDDDDDDEEEDMTAKEDDDGPTAAKVRAVAHDAEDEGFTNSQVA